MTKLVGFGSTTVYGQELACGDVSGDGLADVIVKSAFNLTPPTVSKVTIVYGSVAYKDTIFLATDTTLTRILGESASDDELGRGMLVGDFDKDDVLDFLLGAPRADPMGRENAGKIYLFWGVDSAVSVVFQPSPRFRLFQNRPNPFSTGTTIDYLNSGPDDIVLTIYNVRGQKVATVEKHVESAGVHSISWDGRNYRGKRVPSGVYFYRVRTRGEVSGARKMVIVR
jgi:hypothetical protein